MKSFLRLLLVFVTNVCVAADLGMPTAPEDKSEIIKPEIADDARQAARAAKLPANDYLFSALADSAERQPDAFNRTYSGVPRNLRVARLARYLSTKAAATSEANPNIPFVAFKGGSLNDFHWGYLASDLKFSPVQVTGYKGASLALQSIETRDNKYDFGDPGRRVYPRSVLLLPAATSDSPGIVTLSFRAGNKKALWSGTSDAQQIFLAMAETTKGCEIHVSSKPRGAAVYFNGRKWHRPTDTKSVRDPGEWQVVVSSLLKNPRNDARSVWS